MMNERSFRRGVRVAVYSVEVDMNPYFVKIIFFLFLPWQDDEVVFKTMRSICSLLCRSGYESLFRQDCFLILLSWQIGQAVFETMPSSSSLLCTCGFEFQMFQDCFSLFLPWQNDRVFLRTMRSSCSILCRDWPESHFCQDFFYYHGKMTELSLSRCVQVVVYSVGLGLYSRCFKTVFPILTMTGLPSGLWDDALELQCIL